MQPPVRFYINGKAHFVRVSTWNRLLGPKPPERYACDGCTGVPDSMWSFDVWPACVIHDWHYDPDGPEIRRWVSDIVFGLNCYITLRIKGAGRILSASTAWSYYKGVAFLGAPFFKRFSR